MAKNPNKTLQKYLTRIESAEKHRDQYKELWERLYKRYRNYVDQIVDPETGKVADRSNISIPQAFAQVETILPRLVETLFASRPYVTVKDREPSDWDNAKNMETLLDWQMNERMDMQDIFHTGLKELCIYGTCIAYTGWKFEQKQVIKKQLTTVMDEETGEPIFDDNGEPIQDWQPVRINEIKYDDPEVKFIDLGLFFVDQHAEDIDDARFCGHISYETKERLQELAELGLLKINWKKIEKKNYSNKARNERMSAVGLPTTDDQIPENDEDHLYEVIHYYEDDKYVVIINRSYIAREGESPFWHKKKPYRKGVYIKVPHEFYGMGIIESMEDLIDELNNERNMRIDFRNFILRRMFKVKRDARIRPKDLKWRQGGVVWVDDQEDVQVLDVPDVPSSTFTEEATIKQDIQDATGGYDVVRGTSNSSETATTTMTKDNNASMRFKIIISSIEKKLLVGVARLMMQLNQQFIDAKRVLRLTGEDGSDDWFSITPEEIQGEFDLIATGTSVEPMANKEAYKQRMVELYKITANDQILSQFPDKRMKLLKKVFDAYDIKDTDDLLPSDEELQMILNPASFGSADAPMEDVNINGPAALQEEQGLPMMEG